MEKLPLWPKRKQKNMNLKSKYTYLTTPTDNEERN